MKKDHIEELINKSLKEDPVLERIDIRESTMTQIVDHERRKDKFRAGFQWILTMVTFFTSLFSLYIFEAFSEQFGLYFQAYAVNILAIKSILQFFFAGILLAVIIIMILSLNMKKPAYYLS
jgi:uncharacterized membrane protein